MLNTFKKCLNLEKILNNPGDNNKYPFWNANYAEILANKQNTLPWCHFFQRFTITEHGLEDTLTKEIRPFCILCDHYSTYINKNESRICKSCGLYILKSAIDIKHLEKNCCHPFIYCYYKTSNQIATCYQCKKNIEITKEIEKDKTKTN